MGRQSKALVDKDGVHDTMNMPEDLGAPVFQELDPDWTGTPSLTQIVYAQSRCVMHSDAR